MSEYGSWNQTRAICRRCAVVLSLEKLRFSRLPFNFEIIGEDIHGIKNIIGACCQAKNDF